MIIAIKLVNNMSCEYICDKIQRSINRYKETNDLSDSVIVIDIRKINDEVAPIPKLEHKNISS